jgi:hypothetical protein
MATNMSNPTTFDICVICGEFNRCKNGRCVSCLRDLKEEEDADSMPMPYAYEERSDAQEGCCSTCGEPLEKGHIACIFCEPKVYAMEVGLR